MGYVSLRQRLFDFCDHEGFVPKGNVVAVLREQLGVTEEEVPSKPLDVWLTQLVTMKKDELTASTFMSSLRPALPQKDKRRVLTAFKLLQGPNSNGIVRLGDWLQRLDNGEVKQTVVLAFGAEDEESVANTTVTERVFLELFSDLAPFLDIDSLLQ